MDDRPAPAAYADASWRGSGVMAMTQARKVAGKARQRLRRETRPPAGAGVLSAKVVEHWRGDPDLLEPARGLGVLSDAWLDDLALGRTRPAPGTVAFLVNVLVALEPAVPSVQRGTSRSAQPSTAGRDDGSSSARIEARDS